MQDHRLGEDVRVRVVKSVTESPDTQIRIWDQYRYEQRPPSTSSRRSLWTTTDFIEVLARAIGNEACMKEVRDSFRLCPDIILNLPAAFRKGHDASVVSVPPVGKMAAPVGFCPRLCHRIEIRLESQYRIRHRKRRDTLRIRTIGL